MASAGPSRDRAAASTSSSSKRTQRTERPATPASPAGTEPLPFDDDEEDEEEDSDPRTTEQSNMSGVRSAQDELDAAATLASVVSEPQTMEQPHLEDEGDEEEEEDGNDEDEEEGDDEEDDDEEDEEDDEGEDSLHSDLSSDLSDDETRRRSLSGKVASREAAIGDAHDEEGEEEEEEEEEGDEEDAGSEESQEDASDLSDEDDIDDEDDDRPQEGGEVAAEATALDALAGLAAADPAGQPVGVAPAMLSPQRSRKKSLISAMSQPMLQEEEDERGDDGDAASDDGQSQPPDSQDLTTGDMLSSAIAGAAPRQRHPTGDPNSAGSMLKKSLLSNATEDAELVGAPGGAEGIDASMPVSAKTSRAASPSAPDLGTEHAVGIAGSLTAELANVAAAQGDQGSSEATAGAEAAAEGDGEDDEAALPAADADDEAASDEAALRRREAMDSLAKIEIGFALLRDRLYMERIEETCKESAMILDGTHPELIYLNNLIEARKKRRLELVDSTFDAQEQQFSRIAKADEQTIWSTWRNDMADLRKEMMDDLSRKRRKLDREKRALDAPRPPRRHQVFETELVRNPERITPHQSRSGAAGQANKKRRKAKQAAGSLSDSESVKDYVAFPDLRGLEEEAWVDLERLGIRPPNLGGRLL